MRPARRAPISLEEPMKIWFTAVTRPRRESGLSRCTRDGRTTTVTLSNAPVKNSASSERQNQWERPKTTMAATNPATTGGPVRDGARSGGRDPHGDGERADGRCRAEPAKPDRTAVEDLIGVDGEERDGAARQHGEQVGGAGAEDDFFSPDELGPGKHVAPGALPGGAGRRVEAADRTEQPQKRAPERGHEQDDGGEIGESDKKPAEGGAGHRGDFERTRVPRDRIAEAFVRQKQRRDTGARRPDQNADACVGAEQGKHERQRGFVGLQRGRIAVALEQEGDAPQGRIGPAERGERRDARAEVGQAFVQAIE